MPRSWRTGPFPARSSVRGIRPRPRCSCATASNEPVRGHLSHGEGLHLAHCLANEEVTRRCERVNGSQESLPLCAAKKNNNSNPAACECFFLRVRGETPLDLSPFHSRKERKKKKGSYAPFCGSSARSSTIGTAQPHRWGHWNSWEGRPLEQLGRTILE